MLSIRMLLSALLCWLCLFNPGGAKAESPRHVTVGMYINDIQSVDLTSNSYAVDLYLWFRWKDPAMDPVADFEFMNRYAPDDHVQQVLFDKPVPQPDGSLYQIVRHQGQFTNKFPLQKYPFDRQTLLIAFEDSQNGAQSVQYVADREGIKLSPEIKLPGYQIESPILRIRDRKYDTIFGDLSNPNVGAYSRAEFSVAIVPPVSSGVIKSFVPVWLIFMCAVLALLLDPSHVEARIGLSITALLTLVAMQFTMLSSLPDVSYLTLLDQLFLISYLWVLAVIALIVRGTRTDNQGAITGEEGGTAKIVAHGPRAALWMLITYALAVVAICTMSLV